MLEEGFTQTSINKDDPPLTQGQIEELERSPNRPQLLSLAVECDNRTNKINVEGLYWGVLNLVRKLAEDTEQMKARKTILKSACTNIREIIFTQQPKTPGSRMREKSVDASSGPILITHCMHDVILEIFIVYLQEGVKNG